ncbi:E3 ubiquitin-protein ligase arih1-like [Microplitis mediator]|uniref:E3 ubiquitin-protein ligase arih1-like n=1 Tax=Microplitis mediator TaxID=375433 RepID=UPI00255609B2|nr:E3 ubiquitin-protein ligase arih1-like [Microplitis mediator]
MDSDDNCYDLPDCEFETGLSDDEVEMENLATCDSNIDDYSYQVLKTEEIVGHMLKKIKSISGIIEIPSTITRILLHHFNWDEEKLLDKFYTQNRSELFKEAHIIDPSSSSSAAAVSTSAVSKKNNSIIESEDCEICLVPLSCNLMTGMECGHRFCTDCWDSYLSTKIIEQGECQSITCPAHKCDIIVDDETAMNYIKDFNVKTKYQHLITNSYVESDRLLKWCETPDCNHAIKVSYVDFKPVTCHCGRTFCFKCNKKWHDPILCDLLRKWMKKVDEDAATSAWIGINTKDCPQCLTIIEKNGGCNHMTCRKCRYEFCWICMMNWKEHNTNYKCNRFEADAERAVEKTRSSLRRYMFYSDRFMNHSRSLELENNLYLIVGDKMMELQKMDMSWIAVQFLKKAVDILCKCRQTLMYTYSFAYYIKKSNQSTIFEDNQQDLESAIETLSHYLEQDIDEEEPSEIKKKVQNKADYCESRRKVLLDHVHEGYDKGWWNYTNLE